MCVVWGRQRDAQPDCPVLFPHRRPQCIDTAESHALTSRYSPHILQGKAMERGGRGRRDNPTNEVQAASSLFETVTISDGITAMKPHEMGTSRQVREPPSSRSEASSTTRAPRSVMELPAGSSSPAITPGTDDVRSPSAPEARTEESVQAQAFLSGATALDEAPVSPTASKPSPAPPGGRARPARWLGYWEGGGDITDLSKESQEHNVTTVDAAMEYYAGVDLLGIL